MSNPLSPRRWKSPRALLLVGMVAASGTPAGWLFGAPPGQRAEARSPGQVVAEAAPDEWRTPDPEQTLYFELPGGRVVLELAPWAAPAYVANLKALVRAGHFDGGHVVRSQDNYVVQWAVRPPRAGEALADGIADAIPAELSAPVADLPFTPLPDPDVYAPEAGFTLGFPVGRDPEAGTTWIAHCYGVVAVARGNDPGSGNGSSLAAVIGHGPRHLDRNSAMVGRIVAGAEHLSTQPRGSGNLGFYQAPRSGDTILSAHVAADLPEGGRTRVEMLATESRSFRDYLAAYRSRVEEWFVHRADRLDLCNVRIPTRVIAPEPDGAALAEGAIRARRDAFNDAIARHDAAAMVDFVDEHYQITTGNGARLAGDPTAVWDGVFARAPDIRFVRTPTSVDVAASGIRAFEVGEWRGSWTTADGPQELGGSYSAHWQRDGEWRLLAEIFVTGWCRGPECAALETRR